MDAPRRAEAVDPEFVAWPTPRVRLRDFDPRDHQRLVMNPFLAVLGLIAILRVVTWLYRTNDTFIALFLVFIVALLPRLIHYHCLDCGQTIGFARRNRHACAAVVTRSNEGQEPGFPSSRSQLIVWSWVLGSIGLLVLVIGT